MVIGENWHTEEEGDDDIAYIESLSRSKDEGKIFSTL